MIKVLIVEDSRTAQEFLTYILKSDPGVEVVGTVDDGSQALQAVRETHPDVITMDIHMPKLNGFDATRLIMENQPTPIVIVSASTGAREVAFTFQAMEAGALAVVLRPPGFGHPAYQSSAQELVRTVKLMSEVKVVRRYASLSNSAPIIQAPKVNFKTPREFRLIAMGASTGGPPALCKILSLLPHELPVPLIIVQHIAAGFTEGFVEWLGNTSKFPLHIATQGQQALPGHAYVAPENHHIGIKKDMRIQLSSDAAENGLRPAVSYLFRTAAEELGPQALGVLLTGMGRDGADELKMLKNQGGVTIIQDEASSTVFGMPGEATKLGAATYVLPPEGIAALLVNLVMENHQEFK